MKTLIIKQDLDLSKRWRLVCVHKKLSGTLDESEKCITIHLSAKFSSKMRFVSLYGGTFLLLTHKINNIYTQHNFVAICDSFMPTCYIIIMTLYTHVTRFVK